MKKQFVLYTSLIALAFSSCNDSDNIVVDNLRLLTPNVDAIVYHENVLFEWESDGEGSFTITIASDSTYTTIDTFAAIDTKQFTLTQLLPNKDYFWKVTSEKGEAISMFKTQNLLTDISTYNGDILVREYEERPFQDTNPEPALDTTFIEFIEFDYEDDNLIVSSEFGSFTSTYEMTGIDLESKVATYNEGGGGSNFRNLRYFFEADSITILRHSGGIAGGSRWSTTIIK